MYYQQPKMAFFPVSELEASPSQWRFDYEEVNFKTADGVALHGWYIPHIGAKQVVLFFHGNAGNISHRRETLALFHRLRLNVLMVDYRGYGKSEGVTTEAGLYLDAAAAWSYLIDKKNFDAQQIVIFGRSIGGVVATDLAATVPARALILESTFNSSQDFAHATFPVLSRLVYLRFDFNSEDKIPKVNSPVLVLHSPDDEIIPFELGLRLFDAANEPKTFVRMRGGHNNGVYASQPDYEQSLGSWLKAL